MRRSDICGVCGATKVYNKDGDGICRPCANLRNREYKARNKERIREASQQYRADNRETIKAKAAEYREANKDKQQEYYAKNSEKIKQQSKETRKNKPEHYAKLSKAWQAANPDKVRATKSEYKKRNVGKTNAHTAKRWARKLKAVVPWANEFFIEEVYSFAKTKKAITGIDYHVDHIIPLISEYVCGLHHENNLQLLPAFENISKGNRWWPDMPQYTRQDLHELKYYKWLSEVAL